MKKLTTIEMFTGKLAQQEKNMENFHNFFFTQIVKDLHYWDNIYLYSLFSLGLG